MDRAITVTSGVTMGAAAAVLLAVLVVLLAVTLAGRRRLRRDLDAARATVAELAARVESLDAALAKPAEQPEAVPAPRVRQDPEYVITTVGDASAPARETPGETAPAALTAGQFVSVAVGESLVRVLSFGYGVRRALTAENRNRIAFEMRREVKRSRKQRRREVKEARRHLRTADRDTFTENAAEDAA